MELINTLKSRWLELQPREQQVLRGSAVILGLLLFYMMVIDPVYSGRDDAEQRLRATSEAFSAAQRQAFDLKAALSGPRAEGAGSLLAQIESSAQQQDLRNALKRLQPSGNDQVQISLEGASYTQIIQWLSNLHGQGVRVVQADIQVDRKTDLIAAQLLLAR